MKKTSVNKARKEFSSLLDEVSEQGEDVIIERYGNDSAVMIDVDTYHDFLELKRKQAVRDALEIRRELQDCDLTADELIREQREERSPDRKWNREEGDDG